MDEHKKKTKKNRGVKFFVMEIGRDVTSSLFYKQLFLGVEDNPSTKRMSVNIKTVFIMFLVSIPKDCNKTFFLTKSY